MDYTHLTLEERYQIEGLLKCGHTAADVARVLGRSPSTVGRELKRNGRSGKRYSACAAQGLADERAKGCANAPQIDPRSWSIACEALEEGWSPDEISGRLQLEGRPGISHMTIYRRVYAERQRGGRLHRHLRCRSRPYMRRGDGRGRARPLGGKSIDQRPPEVEQRSTFGHWEGDTMLDSRLRACLLTLVERKSRFTLAAKIASRSAGPVARAINRQLAAYAPLVKTLTLDNGKEFSDHAKLNVDCYFARPYASWQRGTIENTNGLLRQYFPRSRRLSNVRQHHVQHAVDKLNHRPRKCLGYRTPHEALTAALLLHFKC